ncbi:hypothetical protein, partial [Arsenicicoccus bolidensis]|uniref:hypothetical protein n=1 Tax=Arsenicicoccus bolidensis TaxID=229480 RepID=UPI0028ADA8AF
DLAQPRHALPPALAEHSQQLVDRAGGRHGGELVLQRVRAEAVPGLEVGRGGIQPGDGTLLGRGGGGVGVADELPQLPGPPRPAGSRTAPSGRDRRGSGRSPPMAR